MKDGSKDAVVTALARTMAVTAMLVIAVVVFYVR